MSSAAGDCSGAGSLMRTELSSLLTVMAPSVSDPKSTYSSTVPEPTNSVRRLTRNSGTFSLCSCRSTMTWKVPSAATYRLKSRIDCSSTGWLRSVVLSANGFSKLGSMCSARSPKQSATINPKTTPVKISTRANPPTRGGGCAGRSSAYAGYSLVGSSTSAISTPYARSAAESVEIGQFLPQHELVDLGSSLVREHTFEVVGVPH